MPCLSGRVDPTHGPLLTLGIAAAGTIAPALQAGGSAPMIQTCPALVDTGASVTCIAPAIVQALHLVARGKRPVTSATHVVPMNVYLVDLVLPFGTAGLVLDNRQVIEFAPHPTSPFQALLGRDVLGQGAFTLSFDGHFTFSL
jgi:aspartyl protease